jgi:peptide/nickel transport system substrate-binding protein
MINTRKRRGLLAVVPVLVLAGIATTVGAGSSAKAADSSLLRIATYSGVLPTNLSPFYSQGRERADLENMYEPLAEPYLGTLQVRGVLATSWTSSNGGKTWRFNLRKGVKFHDGTPFTAAAVKASFDLDQKLATSDVSPLLKGAKVQVLGKYAVQFTTDGKGFPFIDRIPSLSIVSPTAIKQHGGDQAWWATHVDGTGPYTLDEYVPNDHLTMVRNDKWWGKKPYFQRVALLSVPEASTQQLMLQRGDVDIAYSVPPASLSSLVADKNLHVISIPGDRVLNIRLNVQHTPYNNVAFRKALAYAFDYDAVAKALATQVSPTTGPVPRQYLGGWLPPDIPRHQDLAKARQFLQQSGVNPSTVTMDANFVAGDAKQQVASEILQSSLEKLGIKVNLHLVDFDQTYQKLQRYRADPQGNASAAAGIDEFTLVRGPFVPHTYAYFSSYELATPYNYFNYQNTSALALWQKAYAAKSAKQQLALYKKGVEQIVAQQPDIWAYVEKKVVVMRADITGYHVSPNWFPETHVWTIGRKS